MASGRNSGRRRFITREHASDTSEADTLSTKTPEQECDKKKLEVAHRIGITPSAFVRVTPSSRCATSDRSCGNSKNGLTSNFSRRLPQSTLAPENSEHNPRLTSKWNTLHLHPVICTPQDFFPESPSLGFRPIRRDSVESESSSLAGSAVDSELTMSKVRQDRNHSPVNSVKPPSHPAAKGPTDFTSRARPWSYYDSAMLNPRTFMSSAGSASSYDNLDKPDSLLPAPGRDSQTGSYPAPTLCSPAASRTNCSAKIPKRTPSNPQMDSSSRKYNSPFRSDDGRNAYGLKGHTHGNKSNEVAKENLNVTGEDNGETPHFLEGVCRRRIAGGHIQVIPPHLVGVFDPSRHIAPPGSRAPYGATGDRITERPVESVSTAGKTLESTPRSNLEMFEMNGREILPMNSSSKSNLAYNASHQKPLRIKSSATEFHSQSSPPCGSGGVELSSSEYETTYSFNHAGEEQDNNIRSNVFDVKFSDKVSNSASDNKKKKAVTHCSDLPSVTDLFHYTVAKPGVEPSIGRMEKQEKHDSSMAKAKTTALPAIAYSSTSKQDNFKHPLPSKSNPKWNASPMSVGSQKSDPTSSPKGSPKWGAPKLLKGGYKQKQASSPKSSPKFQKQQSSPGPSPKWQYSPLTKNGQTSEVTSSPKSNPKYEQSSVAKGSPRVERVPSAKASPRKYENTCSPKNSPKAERNSVTKRNLTLETSPSKGKVPASSQLHSQNSFKWETPKTSGLDAAAPPVTTKASDAESNESKVKTRLDRAESFKGTNRISQLHSSSASIQVFGSGKNANSDKEKRKHATGISHLPSVNADSAFPAQRKQLSSSSSKSISVDKSDLSSEKVIENALKITQKQNLTVDTTIQSNNEQQMNIPICERTHINSGIFSVASLGSPQKTSDIPFINDIAFDEFIMVTDEIKVSESQHDVTRSPLDDVEDARMTREDSEEIMVLASQTDDVSVAVEMENRPKAGMETKHDSSDVQDKFDVNFVASFVDNDCTESLGLGKEISEKKSFVSFISRLSNTDDGDVSKLHDLKNVVEDIAIESSRVESLRPQTKMFTDTLESIQVVTQPYGTRIESAKCSTPLVAASCLTLADSVDIPQPVKSFEHVDPTEVTLQSPLGNSTQSINDFTHSSENSDTCSPHKTSNPVDATALPAAVDSVNCNVPESEDGCCSKSKMNVSNGNGRLNSINSSINSSPKAEDLHYQEFESQNSRNQSEVKGVHNIVASDVELTFPSSMEKAIFTVDKEITFVSRLIESPENKSSLLTMVTAKSESLPNSVSASQVMENLEKPMLCVPVSSPPTDVFVSLTVHPLDETTSAFQKPDSPLEMTSTNTCIIPTCEPLIPPSNTIYNCKQVTRNTVQIPVGKGGVAPSKFSSRRSEHKQDEMLNSRSYSESNDQVGTDSGGSAALSKPIAKGMISNSKSPAVVQGSEMPVMLRSCSVSTPFCKTQNQPNNTGNINTLASNATLTRKLYASGKYNLSCVDQKLRISDKKCPEKIAGHPDSENMKNSSAQLPYVSSPVMAALDDAMAVLTSVVMDSKTSGAELSRRIAVPVNKSRKEFAKQDTAKVIFSLHSDIKKGGKSCSSSKDGPSSLSKKKTGISQKERSSPSVGNHHSDPLDTMEIVRQEIQMVENRRHQLAKEDSFNRPDSPMFHETLPLPKDSIIKRNREKCHESSSSSDGNSSPQMSPRLAPRSLRRCKRSQTTDKLSSLPASEISIYKTFPGSQYSSKSLVRHKSDIFLDTRSGPPSSLRFQKPRWHNSDIADVTQGTLPKTLSVPQGMDLALTSTLIRDSKRLPLRSDIQDLQQSLLLYNEKHGGRRGQSWMQTADVSSKGTIKWSALLRDKPS